MTTAQKDKITRRLVHIASLLSGGGSFFAVTAAMTFPEVDPSAAFGFKLKDASALASGDISWIFQVCYTRSLPEVPVFDIHLKVLAGTLTASARTSANQDLYLYDNVKLVKIFSFYNLSYMNVRDLGGLYTRLDTLFSILDMLLVHFRTLSHSTTLAGIFGTLHYLKMK